jgi:prevent-host-death family protein
MTTATEKEAKSGFGELLKATASGPVAVTRSGRPVAVLLGVETQDDVERILLGHSPRLREILDESRRQIAEGKGIPHKEFWAKIKTRTAGASRKRGRNGSRAKPSTAK